MQIADPYTYLGYELLHHRVLAPRIQLCTSHLQTLNDFQKLLGDIQWLRPYLKLPTHALLPLNEILNGDPNPLSPRKLSPEAQASLTLINCSIQDQTVFQIDYDAPLLFVICSTSHTRTGVFWQNSPKIKDKGHSLLWVHLPASPQKVLATYPFLVAQLIIKARKLSCQYFGKDTDFSYPTLKISLTGCSKPLMTGLLHAPPSQAPLIIIIPTIPCYNLLLYIPLCSPG